MSSGMESSELSDLASKLTSDEFAARFPQRVQGLVVLAPHIVVEDLTVDSIAQARTAYLTTDLPRRLKPINIYFHFYSGTKIGSLKVLKMDGNGDPVLGTCFALRQGNSNIYGPICDNADYDVGGAQSAGLRGMWISHGRDWDQAQPPPDAIAVDITSAMALLRGSFPD